jgi:hypothetical protein
MSIDDPWAIAQNALSGRSRVVALAHDWDEIVRSLEALVGHATSGVRWKSRAATYADARADSLLAEARLIREQLWNLAS